MGERERERERKRKKEIISSPYKITSQIMGLLHTHDVMQI
jgi:hypothetical protein